MNYDILLNPFGLFIAFLIAAIISFAIGGYIGAYAQAREQNWLFILAVSFLFIAVLIPFILAQFLLFPVSDSYKALRTNFAPASWQTVQVAFDFVFGYYLLLIVEVFIGFILVAVFFVFIAPMYLLLKKQLSTAFNSSIGMVTILVYVLYVLTFFDNCSFVSIEHEIQSFLYGSAGKTIFFSVPLENWIGNHCSITEISRVDIANHPIALSKFSFQNLEHELIKITNDQQSADLLSRIIVYMSPVADFLGIYLGIYTLLNAISRQKQSDKASKTS